jgi:hypothetical protein
MIVRAHHNLAATIISGVTLTTKLFTLAVFVYCGLNFLMCRRIRKLKKAKERDDDQGST